MVDVEIGGEDDKKQNSLAPLDLCKATVSAKERKGTFFVYSIDLCLLKLGKHCSEKH